MSVNPIAEPGPALEDIAFKEMFSEYNEAATESLAVPEGTEPAPAARFEIDDDSKANWALGVIRQLNHEDDKDLVLYKKEKSRLDTWLNQAKKKRSRTREYFESLLLRYYKTLKAADPKIKTVQLPNGQFIEKSLPGKGFEMLDEQQVLDWARANAPEFIKVEESVDWTSFKTYLTANSNRAIWAETGEVIPGVAPVLPETRFYVTPSKE
jgi:hypothetical protein